MVTTLEDLLDKFLNESTSTREQGDKFERLMQSFLRVDTQWAGRLDEVWMWSEWEGRHGRPDTGIDLVARERDTGDLIAVQCKFFDPRTTISKSHIDSFLSDSGKEPFAHRLIVTTSLSWGPNAEAAIHGQKTPVQRLDLTDLLDSSIDWSQFDFNRPEVLEVKKRHDLHTYQRDALEAVRTGFTSHDRGKLIMACGTGKTFTSLRIAEDLVPLGGSILFLVPSIALLSQSLKEWSIEASESLRTFAVCSDGKVGRSADEDISVVDLAIPATTDPEALHAKLVARSGSSERLTVVFATYQSIGVVAQAQALGAPAFDLVICDEAHRTTGATALGNEASVFQRVHDSSYLHAAKRLYMTATPRIYDDASKAKAGQTDVLLSSMDDEADFGPEFYRLGFGDAVAMGRLTDYKVLVLAVDEGSLSRTFQDALTDPANSELRLDDVAKIVGCWNGLSKRGSSEHDFSGDPVPMRRAVAFARSIKDSKAFAARFESIVEEFVTNTGLRKDGDVFVLPATAEHVDGTNNILQRNQRLEWLKSETPDLECRVLSNAKCLSEGVDVPALDAVLFLNPRKSIVDVVQSVGRVMRTSPGKKFGYIILPIGIPAGVSPEVALQDNKKYAVVWDVLQALRAHDERFDAMVNKIDLNTGRDDRIQVIGVGGGPDDGDRTIGAEGGNDRAGQQLSFNLDALGEWRDAIYAKIVSKVGSRRYWEDWANSVADIAERHRTRLHSLIQSGRAADEFEAFHTALQANLNPAIRASDAVDMLSQHMITRPVFEALFADYSFAAHNPVSQVMQTMLEALEGSNLEAETAELDPFYESVRVRAEGIDNAAGKQKIITELYERFFKRAFPRSAEALGIVYTPLPVVDFILRSVDHLLRVEFGASLSDEGVHVVDPFTGTGTFVVRLLQSGLISQHDLARKYTEELHANEITLLAYYIAAINIEATYHDLLSQADADSPEDAYVPFDGIVLTDTFQMTENGDLDDGEVFTRNNERVTAQRALDIRVIVGNPPYSVGQTSGNDNNANVGYPTLDGRIEATYAARSTATNKNSLYDSYVRAIRWASDRIFDAGVIGFVTNGGFIDSNTADGLRKTLAEEFTTIYIYNLRGNQRTTGEQSRREGGKIFGAGSRNTVAITLLVKHPGRQGKAEVHYHDIGDYLSQQAKLELVQDATIESLPWEVITPNDAGDWINQRGEESDTFQPLGERKNPESIFESFGRGLETGRDPWVYNFSRTKIASNVGRMVLAYNDQVRAFQALRENVTVEDFVDTDPKRISWARSLKQSLGRGTTLSFNEDRIVSASYRPFTREWVYFARLINHEPGQMPRYFPTPTHPNLGFVLTDAGSHFTFCTIATDLLPNLHLLDTGKFFARYTYEPASASEAQGVFDLSASSESIVIDGYRRLDNITDATLVTYRAWYGADVTKDDIFAFIYGLLHSPDYRERFGADLKRSLPRIPRIHSEDFPLFRDSGSRLLELHVGYEDVTPYPLTITGDHPVGAGSADHYAWFQVKKLAWGGKTRDKDRSTIVYNPRITISGIPDATHEYMLGSRSALEWILDRYQMKTDKPSQIENDPNDYSREIGNPRYILDLIGRVVTVSVETVEIITQLPRLRLIASE